MLPQTDEKWCLVAVTPQTSQIDLVIADCIILYSVVQEIQSWRHGWKHIKLTLKTHANVSQGGVTVDFQSNLSLTLKGYTASHILRSVSVCMCPSIRAMQPQLVYWSSDSNQVHRILLKSSTCQYSQQQRELKKEEEEVGLKSGEIFKISLSNHLSQHIITSLILICYIFNILSQQSHYHLPFPGCDIDLLAQWIVITFHKVSSFFITVLSEQTA